MVVVIATDSVSSKLDDMNSVGRYQFYKVKAISPDEILSELEMLSGITHVIYDMGALPHQTSANLLEPLCNKNINIIVIATGMNPYDIVVQDFYGYGISDVFTESGNILMKNINDALLRGNAHAAEPVSNMTIPKTSTSIEKVSPVPAAGNNPLIDTGRLPKAATVAFAGAGPRIGTTTQVFQTALYLSSLYIKVAIVDVSGSSWIKNTETDPNIKKIGEYEYLVYGIPYHTSQNSIAKLRIEYQYLVYDYGTFDSIPDLLSFTEKDSHIVVCGYKPMERMYLMPVFKTQCETLLYLFSFVPEESKTLVRASMVEYGSNSFFSGYSPDIFKYAGNDKLYEVLTQHISIKSPEHKKSGLFAGLLRKG